MNQLIFDESTMINGNIFKFEQRLHTHLNKYIENGPLLTNYFSQRESATTVDRGTKDIDQLFGKKSPLRFNRIRNFPLYGFGQANPDNTDEMQIEDINVDGDCIILPTTIVPKPLDFFTINHLKMTAVFEVTNVTYDSMKVDGYYKIHYRLISTSRETLESLENQTVEKYSVELNAIGSNINPIIQEDDMVYRKQVQQMVNKMIQAYKAMYYNDRHNCFLFHNPTTGEMWFDMCANEFMSKYGLMNPENSTNVVVLVDKLNDPQMSLIYNNSVYNWIELGAPSRLLQPFKFSLKFASQYPYSSFAMWSEGDIQIMQPLSLGQPSLMEPYSMFDNDQMQSFMDPSVEPGNEFDKLIWKFIYNKDNLTIHDVSLYTADTLLSSIKHTDTFLYTPIVLYIIRMILRMN